MSPYATIVLQSISASPGKRQELQLRAELLHMRVNTIRDILRILSEKGFIRQDKQRGTWTAEGCVAPIDPVPSRAARMNALSVALQQATMPMQTNELCLLCGITKDQFAAAVSHVPDVQSCIIHTYPNHRVWWSHKDAAPAVIPVGIQQRLFDFLCAAPRPVKVREIVEATGISRSAAKKHLSEMRGLIRVQTVDSVRGFKTDLWAIKGTAAAHGAL